MANPLIRRYQYSLLRPEQGWIYGVVYVSLVGLILIVNLLFYARQSVLIQQEPWQPFRSLFFQFTVFQCLLLWVLAPSNTGGVIPNLMLQKAYDFLRLLPLSAVQKIVGIVLGRNLLLLSAAAANFLFFAMFGLLGRISWSMLLQIALLLLSVGLFLCLLSLLLSLRSSPKRGNPFLLFLVLFFTFGLPFFPALIYNTQEARDVSFYFWRIPLLIAVSGVLLYFSVWAFLGNRRWFTYEYESLFSWKGAMLFQLLFLLLLFGFFYPYRQAEQHEKIFIGFCIAGLVPVVLLPTGACRTYEKYLELSRGFPTEKMSVFDLFRRSNPVLSVLIYLIWLGFFLGGCRLFALSAAPFLLFAGVVFTFYLVWLGLLELTVVFYNTHSKIILLTGFVIVLYLFLSFILSGLFDWDYLSVFSPLGYLVYVSSRYPGEIPLPPVFPNLFLCTAPIIQIFGRYKWMIDTRKALAKVS